MIIIRSCNQRQDYTQGVLISDDFLSCSLFHVDFAWHTIHRQTKIKQDRKTFSRKSWRQTVWSSALCLQEKTFFLKRSKSVWYKRESHNRHNQKQEWTERKIPAEKKISRTREEEKVYRSKPGPDAVKEEGRVNTLVLSLVHDPSHSFTPPHLC